MSDHEVFVDDYDKGIRCERRGGVVFTTLLYPNVDGRPSVVEVDQESVRASDGIRITYDYARDGYSILQASTFSWEADDEKYDGDWQEVAFVQAWARCRPEDL